MEVPVSVRRPRLRPEQLTRLWSERPLADLIDHLLLRYHRTLERDLEELDAMIDAFPGGRRTLRDLARCVETLSLELLSHMHKEEKVLFPWILAGDGDTAATPITVMQHEHGSTRRLLDRLARLLEAHTPEKPSPRWRRMCELAQHIAHDLEEHMVLEDTILFPRALTETRR